MKRKAVERELQQAIKLHPLDLVKRLDYLHERWDRRDAEHMAVVAEAIEITRNGRTQSRPRRGLPLIEDNGGVS